MIHASLSSEQNQAIERDLQYSDDDLVVLDKLRSVIFAGLPLSLPEADKWMFTTMRGIAAQIERFNTDAGLIYWIAIQDDRCEMKKAMVHTPS
jgi:hypothetical protein